MAIFTLNYFGLFYVTFSYISLLHIKLFVSIMLFLAILYYFKIL
jgi:hypothetical protein